MWRLANSIFSTIDLSLWMKDEFYLLYNINIRYHILFLYFHPISFQFKFEFVHWFQRDHCYKSNYFKAILFGFETSIFFFTILTKLHFHVFHNVFFSFYFSPWKLLKSLNIYFLATAFRNAKALDQAALAYMKAADNQIANGSYPLNFESKSSLKIIIW